MLSVDHKKLVKESLNKLQKLAEELDNASMFNAVYCAKKLAVAQLEFNILIGALLCN